MTTCKGVNGCPVIRTASRTVRVAKFGNTAYAQQVDGRKSAGRLLRELREAQKRNLRGAAEELGLAPSQLSRIERGERSLTPQASQRLANYYGIQSEALALAEGQIPADIVRILSEHPEELARLRALYGEADDDQGTK